MSKTELRTVKFQNIYSDLSYVRNFILICQMSESLTKISKCQKINFRLVNCQKLNKIRQMLKMNSELSNIKIGIQIFKCQNWNRDVSNVKKLNKTVNCQKTKFKFGERQKSNSDLSNVWYYILLCQMSESFTKISKCQKLSFDLSIVKYLSRSVNYQKKSELSNFKIFTQICQMSGSSF